MWDAVPVDECIVQLEFKHKVPQTILNGCARLINTIGAGRKNAQGIGSASIHGCWWWLMVEVKKGENFWLWAETRNASRRASRVKWFCLRQKGTVDRINHLAERSPFGLASFPIGWTCAWHPGNKNHRNYAWPPWPVDDIGPKLHSLTSSSVESGCCCAGLRAPPVRRTCVMIR